MCMYDYECREGVYVYDSKYNFYEIWASQSTA